MTSPSGSEHVSRYRALGEFDNLVRAAKEAKRALKELREEEAKLNAQSIADDKKVIASKNERAKAEKAQTDAAKKATADLNVGNPAGKSGEDAGVEYSRGVGRGVERESKSGRNRQFVAAATDALRQAFESAGEDSGVRFTRGARRSLDRESEGLPNSPGFNRALRNMRDLAGRAGQDTGNRYVMGFASKIADLNNILSVLGFDKLDLDVDIDDAKQSIKAIEFELTQLSHTTAEPQVRIDTNRALVQLRAIQKLFKDEVAEDIIKESKRIQEELRKVDALPSGKSFKFWALTALSDMSRVFSEAERGTSIFTRLRAAIAGGSGGGGGNIFRTAISGFDEFSEASSNLLQRLSRVSGELYRMPGIIAVLVASLPALISGIGALGGAMLGLSSGLGAVSGLVLAFPGLGAAMIGTIGALSSSLGGLSDVLKEAKKAQADELYEKEKARLGTEKALTPLQKYTALINAMLPATQTTTLAIVEFADAWTNVSERIGENFFKEVVDDVEKLPEVLTIAENFFGKSATALGKVTSEGIKMLTSGPWKKDFAILAEENAKIIENFGMAGLSLAEAFKNIAVAAAPFNGWLTRSIRNAADAFADWSETARRNGSIGAFLGETQESLQVLWQIIKNVGNVLTSFFKTTVDEGQVYLRTLEDITGHWADVAKAQEDANSPLRQWMVQIRPILSALGALVGDLARGIAGLATNQNSVQAMIDLLDSLRTRVLPPILSILQHLNDSGIAVTVVNALGEILDAISTFLDSGATQALAVFVTVLGEFFSLIANIASLPVVSDILGGLAASIAALAAVSIVARFTGLFKLWDFFTWMSRNRGNLSGAFADAARGVAGLSTAGAATNLPANIPSTIGNRPGTGGVGSEARTITNVGNAAQTSATKVGFFNRALSGMSTAGQGARGALSSLGGFLGGPWGIAITAAITGVTLLSTYLADQKQDADDTKNAFLALKGAYTDLQGGDTSGIMGLAETNDKLKEIITSASQYKVSLTDISGALNGQEQSLNRVNSQLDAQINFLNSSEFKQVRNIAGRPVVFDMNKEAVIQLQRYKDQINEVAGAQSNQSDAMERAARSTRTYQERLGGLTQSQVDSAVQIGEYQSKIDLLSGALDTLSSATSTNAKRSQALSDIIGYTKGPLEQANEAAEQFNSSLLTLSETAEANGRSLSKKTREGLRNRDALQEAAKATRDLYLQDIASGVPMDEAVKRHEKRIKRLKEEAEETYGQKKAVTELIDVYGDIPESMKTDIIPDEKGFAAVFVELSKLQVMQKALQEGKSLSAAEEDWRKESNKFYQRYIPGVNGDGYGAPGFATGGAVYGAGTKTSDSIRAWLSNGEFVQPADSVDYYGLPLMEAIRKKTLDRSSIFEALPSGNNATFASGGQVHSESCMACQSGGHKFADGGSVRVPMVVTPKGTMVDKDWVYAGAGALGGGGGGRGWQWQMNVLRQAFPGLPLWSGYRPGSRTLSGNQSYHALGRAVDLPPRRDVAQWIRSNYGAQTKELITPFNDLNIWNGKPHRYTGAVWNQHNFAGGNAHDHWAFNQGGLVDLMKMMNMDNLAPSQSTSLPSTPRSLSSAASSVVNNSTDNARTFGDVIINNPMPERAGDSIRDALYRTQLLY